MWHRVQQIHQPGVAVVSDATLAAVVVMVGGNEAVERHATCHTVPEHVDHLSTEVLQLLLHDGTAAQTARRLYGNNTSLHSQIRSRFILIRKNCNGHAQLRLMHQLSTYCAIVCYIRLYLKLQSDICFVTLHRTDWCNIT